MRPIATVLLLSLPLLTACNNLSTASPAAAPTAVPASQPATAVSSPASSSQSLRLQGNLINNGSVQIKPCDGRPAMPLDTSTDAELMARMVDAMLQGDTRPWFIDLSGHMARAEGETESRLVPDQIYRLESTAQGCQDREFSALVVRANGHAPEWSVRVLNKGLLLEQAGKPARVLPYLAERLPDGGMGFTSAANGERVELWLAPSRCTDSQTDAIHHLQASLRLNGDKPLTGCASIGGAR